MSADRCGRADEPNVATFDQLVDARTHLVDYHRIDPALLFQVEMNAPISLRIGSQPSPTKPWALPKYGVVIEPYHHHLPAEIAGDEHSSA